MFRNVWIAVSLFGWMAACLANETKAPLAVKGTLLFEDTFERETLGDRWRVAVGDFHLEKGRLIGNEKTEDKHGAAARALSNFKDGVVEFAFRMGNVKTFNFVIDQKGFTGSHAGHICRVVITPARIRLGDDKEGAMRNDLFEMKKDPAKSAEVEALLKDRSATFPVNFDPQEWHKLTVEIIDDEMQVSLDDRIVGSLRSPGIAHASKTDVGFTVVGQGAEFDNMRIWSATSAAKR